MCKTDSLDALARAIAAADLQDWTATLDGLQQLPWSERRALSSELSEQDWQWADTLAIQVLRQGDFAQRWEISKVIQHWGSEAIALLLNGIGNEDIDSETHWFISRLLSHFDHPASLLAWIELLQQNPDEELSAIAIQSLAQMQPATLDAFQPLLADDQSRLLAVKTLAQIRRPETIDLLLSVVTDADPQVRAIAIEALGSFHDQRIMPILIQGLGDRASIVRREAVSALGMRPDQNHAFGLVRCLSPLLFDFSEQVSIQAAIALGRMGTIEAAQALWPVLKSLATPVDLKLEIVRALGWIEDAIALNYLREGLRWSDHLVCLQIIQVLGSQSRPDLKSLATEILITFFQSGQKVCQWVEIRQALAMALGELGESTAIALLQIWAEDSDRGLRLHAQAALRKIPSLQRFPQ